MGSSVSTTICSLFCHLKHLELRKRTLTSGWTKAKSWIRVNETGPAHLRTTMSNCLPSTDRITRFRTQGPRQWSLSSELSGPWLASRLMKFVHSPCDKASISTLSTTASITFVPFSPPSATHRALYFCYWLPRPSSSKLDMSERIPLWRRRLGMQTGPKQVLPRKDIPPVCKRDAHRTNDLLPLGPGWTSGGTPDLSSQRLAKWPGTPGHSAGGKDVARKRSL
ncbi:hypothetical protein CH63R_00387 [Colletotrichum higginsianum IMI 349063]|uniref:Uncharacterized protein n=1 Tax=Colletotrichum higginsianum (strain IMI 349063) TaxID=759273 RepID=A0A1B7YT43_COLHI|nr:hypothetical protein CH63R_00387 [Colletotrichum higginsianum IMI 349063]OBR15207.1 hypothetical protein CH63R_00387 [Colletotrichum higginsianum IMI 349063]